MSTWRKIFFPFSILYAMALTIRNKLYDWGVFRSVAFETPIICVGNISTGGTGKTPHIEYLIKLFKDGGKRVATISRGYGRKTRGFILAQAAHTTTDIGDEPLQFKSKFQEITVAVDEKRVNAISILLHQSPKPDVILLDDAFQHRAVSPTLSIVLTDYNNPYYEDYILPAGNLREPISGADRADAIVVTKCPPIISDLEMQSIRKKISPTQNQVVFFSTISYSRPVPVFADNVKGFFGSEFILVAGIAKTTLFIEHIASLGKICKQYIFPDHHEFTEDELKEIIAFYSKNKNATTIITTEKDAMRLKKFASLFSGISIYYIPIAVQFLQSQPGFNEFVSKKAAF